MRTGSETCAGALSQGGAGARLAPTVPKKGQSERKRDWGWGGPLLPGGQDSRSGEVTSEQRQEGKQGLAKQRGCPGKGAAR